MKRELGWEPQYTFETGIDQTIRWFLTNEAWWRPLKQRGLDAQRAKANQAAKV
ncbi:dTDP-glucose 4,6-dehydratase 2 [compost metagenome]